MGVDDPGEVHPWVHAIVQLQAMVPKLGVVQEIERGIQNSLVIWRPANTKIMLAPVQPRKRITGPVELGKN
jgi:hypothetical protein